MTHVVLNFIIITILGNTRRENIGVIVSASVVVECIGEWSEAAELRNSVAGGRAGSLVSRD